MADDDSSSNNIQERLRETASRGLLSWLNPFNWSFGGLLMLGLVGFGLYFFGATDRGRAMIGDFFNGLSPEWQNRLAGWGASLGMLPDGVTAENAPRIMAIARAHGVNPLGGVDGFLQADVMYDLMTREPAAVIGMASGMARRNGGATGGEPSPTMRRAMGAIREIINRPDRLNTLFDPTNRANTYALLEAVSPIPVAPGTLGTFITAVGLQANGQPKPEFVRFLNGLLADTESERNAAMIQFMTQVAQTNPAALQALARGVNVDQIANPALRSQIQMLQGLASGDPATARSALGIADNLREQGASVNALVTEASSVTGLVNIMTTPEKLALLAPNTERFGAFAQSLVARAPENSPQRTILGFLGTTATVDGRADQAVNVRAIHTFFTTVAQDPTNRGTIEQTRGVMRSMMVMMGFPAGAGETIAPLNPQQVAAFFRNEANVRAFDTLLQQIDPSRLPEGMRTAIASLRTNWAPHGPGDNNYMDNGLAEVFASPLSVQWLLNRPQSGPGMLSFSPGLESFVGSIIPTRLSGIPQQAKENMNYLIAVRNALANAGVSLDGAAAAPARPAAAAPARSS